MQTAPQNSILSVIESTTINQDSLQSTFLLYLWMQEMFGTWYWWREVQNCL